MQDCRGKCVTGQAVSFPHAAGAALRQTGGMGEGVSVLSKGAVSSSKG